MILAGFVLVIAFPFFRVSSIMDPSVEVENGKRTQNFHFCPNLAFPVQRNIGILKDSLAPPQLSGCSVTSLSFCPIRKGLIQSELTRQEPWGLAEMHEKLV